MPAIKSSGTRQPAAQAERPPTVYGEKEYGSLSGNVTMDVELKFTPTGRTVATINVAVNENVKNEKTGEWEETEPEFYRVTAWGRLAENCAEYITRGQRIIAIGYFQDQTYVNRDGEKVTNTTFTARELGPSMLFHGATTVKPVSRSKGK